MKTKPSRMPALLAGRKQTRVDVPRVLRLTDRWTRRWYKRGGPKANVDQSRVFFLWVHRGDWQNTTLMAEWALEENDKLAALIATLVSGMTATQASKIVNEFTRRAAQGGA